MTHKLYSIKKIVQKVIFLHTCGVIVSNSRCLFYFLQSAAAEMTLRNYFPALCRFLQPGVSIYCEKLPLAVMQQFPEANRRQTKKRFQQTIVTSHARLKTLKVGKCNATHVCALSHVSLSFRLMFVLDVLKLSPLTSDT